MSIEHSISRGIYYGYPQCCIDWFVQNIEVPFPDIAELNEKQEAVHNGTGFIPCPACAELVTKETLFSLISNRQCKTDFPVGDF